MSTMQTAAEIYLKHTQCVMNHADIKTAMIEFAKLHVEAALKAAIKNAEIDYWRGECILDDDSILNSYPLDKIK